MSRSIAATLCQQVFNIPVAKIESKVKPDSVADDIGWKPVTLSIFGS